MRNYIQVLRKVVILTFIPTVFLLNGCVGSSGSGGGAAADSGQIMSLEKSTEKSFDNIFGGVYVEKGKSEGEGLGLFLSGDYYQEMEAEVSSQGEGVTWTSIESIGLSSSTNSVKRVNTTFNNVGFKFFNSSKKISIEGSRIGDKELRITRRGTQSNLADINVVFVKYEEPAKNSGQGSSSSSGSGWGVVF